MKTYKNLYPQVYDFANLYLAYRQARLGKRDRVAVASFEFDLERNLFILQTELQTHTYKPGEYTNFYIHEPKRRLVSAAPFRDRVVHHALCNVIEPIWEARFIPLGRRRIDPAGRGMAARLTGRCWVARSIHDAVGKQCGTNWRSELLLADRLHIGYATAVST